MSSDLAEMLIKFHIMKYHARLKAGEFVRFEKIMNGPGFDRISKLFLIMVIFNLTCDVMLMIIFFDDFMYCCYLFIYAFIYLFISNSVYNLILRLNLGDEGELCSASKIS